MADTTNSTRLNKYLALHLGISRREADEYIQKGRVAVNGQLAPLGTHVLADDIVEVDKKPVTNDTIKQYYLFHKPVNYVCSRKPQGSAPTIYEIIPPELHALKPVGRLDKNSSGLLLLTNDGDAAHRMTHPSFHKIKVYEVQLDTPLQPLHQQMISDFGVMLEDGRSQFIITKSDQDATQSTPTYTITMSEGRNRQIRRTFAALGYTVTTLHRTQFGNYSIGDIKPGELLSVDIS